MPLVGLERGYFRFSVIFTWDHTEDTIMAQRLMRLHNNLGKYGIKHDQGVYLIGKRTFIIIGQVKSAAGLQELCSTVIFGTTISADISHVIGAHELADIMKSMARKAQKAK
jgi:hypothetical protein